MADQGNDLMHPMVILKGHRSHHVSVFGKLQCKVSLHKTKGLEAPHDEQPYLYTNYVHTFIFRESYKTNFLW
jgi:hypothetical protein